MYCIPLDEAVDIEVAGGKAVNLAWAGALGVRVPATIVVARRALQRFIDHNGLGVVLTEFYRLPRQGSSLEAAFERLAAEVRGAAVPPDLVVELERSVAALVAEAPAGLAIRSSAIYEDTDAASFAGVFESSVGIHDVEAAVRAVVACWLSGWAPRALRYLERMGIEPVLDPMAVMIQPLVPASAAGVIVTANPESGDPWEFVVHATRGLSVDLMSGSGAGDRYRLDWETGEVRDRELHGATPVTSASQLAEIAATARRLDEAASKREDVEWALAGGLWTLQVRPLTALPVFASPEMRRLDAGESWQLAPFVLPLRGDQPPGLLTPFYADLSESELWYRYQPEDIVLTGIWTREVDVHGYRYVNANPGRSFLDHLTGVDDFERWLVRHEGRYRERWANREDELAGIIATAQSAIRDSRSAAELIPATIAVRDRLWDLNSFGWSGPQALGWLCEAMFGRFLRAIEPSLTVSSLIGGEESYTFALAVALQDLGRSIEDERVRAIVAYEPLGSLQETLESRASDCEFLRRYEALCWRFGKTPPSWRVRPPFWRTVWDDGDAAAMRAIRAALRREGRDVREAQRAARRERDRMEVRVREVLATRGAAAERGRFDRMLGWTRYWTQALNDRHGIATGLLWERELIWHLGVRLAAEGLLPEAAGVLLLRAADLIAYAQDGNRAGLIRTFEARAREDRCNRRFAAPARYPVAGEPPSTLDRLSPASESEPEADAVLVGRGFGRGRATGRARIIRALTPAVLDALTTEDVIVVLDENAFAYTDWHSLLLVVRGVVSAARPAHHLTQVAREVGVPVVGHINHGIGRIRDGSLLQLDAERGTVEVE